ncbi:MAG: bifunctional 4-hydroxy-2-oxoglutarate aldolase/2-dehydro-3-deoxy-phosphogluconate aldolase [Cyanobacteria bacterium J06628_6]
MPIALPATNPQLTCDTWVSTLQRHRIIAVIRADSIAQGLHMAHAAAQGGIRLIEITWNSAEPITLLRTVQQALPHCWVGVGTVLSVAALEMAIAAGAEFCFSPHLSVPMIERARVAEVPMTPGVMTPTEMVTAWQAGAASVKVFPITALGGAGYIRALQGPLGHIPLVPTGGVSEASAKGFLAAGATAVGLSSGLFVKQEVDEQNWAAIGQRAQRLVTACAQPSR